jgi:hypothetical protein
VKWTIVLINGLYRANVPFHFFLSILKNCRIFDIHDNTSVMKDIKKMTMAELRKECRCKKIQGYSNLKKKDLVLLIETNSVLEDIQKGVQQLLKVL